MPPSFDSLEDERDAIFSLLALAAVAATWDGAPLGEGSGHNIGAILVDKRHRPIAFARNESTGRRDLTEHAELRLIRGHIAAAPERTELNKHEIYTTLEPCVMCAGMMAMTNVRRAVYAQPDPLYGGVFERLAAGEKPYPKRVAARPAPGSVASPILDAFAASGMGETIEWLPTPAARGAFAECAARFETYSPAFTGNATHLEDARQFLQSIKERHQTGTR